MSKKFTSDIRAANAKAATGVIPGVVSVVAGDQDGEVVVTFNHKGLHDKIRIHILAEDPREYPDGNVFQPRVDHDIPDCVKVAINAARDSLIGITVYEMVVRLANILQGALRQPSENGDNPNPDPEEEEVDDIAYSDDDDYYDDFAISDDDNESHLEKSSQSYSQTQLITPSRHDDALLQRLREDLRKVCQAGYKVGFLDFLGLNSTTGHVSISIHVRNLALSDEVMEAWNLVPSDYVVLVLRYEQPYQPLGDIFDKPSCFAAAKFRIGKCKKFKPSCESVLAAFSEMNRALSRDHSSSAAAGEQAKQKADDTFEQLFISKFLNELLNKSFISGLNLRKSQRLSWSEAAEAQSYLERGQSPPDSLGSPRATNNLGWSEEIHPVLRSDHLLDSPEGLKTRSFPLIAMQFSMYFLLKCTEYCLICRRQLEKGFQALRPYVCSDPLCLFQYMSMGFGPSIEHEILTEPYVVDLLVSLCYAAVQPITTGNSYTPVPAAPMDPTTPVPSTRAPKLFIRSLPVGLHIRVPDLTQDTEDGKPLKARYQRCLSRLIFESQDAEKLGSKYLSPGKWVAIKCEKDAHYYHAKFTDFSRAGRYANVEVITVSDTPPSGSSGEATNYSNEVMAAVFPYAVEFDSLSDGGKAVVMQHVLDTLPSILWIEDWLVNHPQQTIRDIDRISQAASSLLQWIVSSNRSCIYQVDRTRAVVKRPLLPHQASESAIQDVSRPAGRGRNREPERIPGMEGWVQFRFAQGTPDKELRFNRALREVAARKDIKKHPTIFAWHGSSLANWHSIIRTGLDYNETRNGRSYGDAST